MIDIINKLREVLFANDQIETAFLYGSFARKTPSVNSDVDIATVTTNNFDVEILINDIKLQFSGNLLKVLKVNLRSKIALYFSDSPKVEIAFGARIEEHNRNYLGSEIAFENIESSMLFDKSGGAILHFQKITKTNATINQDDVKNLIDKFIYEFESCSNAHRRSDGYHFYYFYNIALHISVQLFHLSKGETKYNFLPKNFITEILSKEDQNDFYAIKASLFLPEANQQKRKLLIFFYKSIHQLISKEERVSIKLFCEAIYSRDFLWNFRDISKHNPRIKKGVVYRTATMTLFQAESFFQTFIRGKEIGSVVDLRADREVLENIYNSSNLEKFKYIHAPFDPWNQSTDFQASHNNGSNIEIAYRFFLLECKKSIKITLEAILKAKGATAIHCHAGKDRTGIVISLLHLLSGADLETVQSDYLASEMDTKKEYLDIILDIIQQENGIERYLITCDLTLTQIGQLKDKITNGDN